jgi:hypothetical protein
MDHGGGRGSISIFGVPELQSAKLFFTPSASRGAVGPLQVNTHPSTSAPWPNDASAGELQSPESRVQSKHPQAR